MESLLVKTLKQIKKTGKMIALRTNENDTEAFSAGFLVHFSENYIWIKSITPEGFYDGYKMIRLQDVFEISHKDKYLENLETLYKKQKQTEYNEIFNFFKECSHEIENYLKICTESKILLTVQTIYDYSLSGYISNADDEFYIIETLDEYAKPDGQTCCKIQDIVGLNFDSDYERKLSTIME